MAEETGFAPSEDVEAVPTFVEPERPGPFAHAWAGEATTGSGDLVADQLITEPSLAAEEATTDGEDATRAAPEQVEALREIEPPTVESVARPTPEMEGETSHATTPPTADLTGFAPAEEQARDLDRTDDVGGAPAAEDSGEAPAIEATETPSDESQQSKRPWWRGLFGARDDEQAPGDVTVPESPQEPVALQEAEAQPREMVAEVRPEAVESAPEPEVELQPLAEAEEDAPPAASTEALEEPEASALPEAPAAEAADEQSGEGAEEPGEAEPITPPVPSWLEDWQRAGAALAAGEIVAAMELQEEVLARALLAGDGAGLLEAAGSLPGLHEQAYRELSALGGRERADALLALARGAVLIDAGRVQAATETYEDLISTQPGFLPVQIELARAMAISGKEAEARAKLNAVATVYELRGQTDVAGYLRQPTET